MKKNIFYHENNSVKRIVEVRKGFLQPTKMRFSTKLFAICLRE